jgi:hypothetical protein
MIDVCSWVFVNPADWHILQWLPSVIEALEDTQFFKALVEKLVIYLRMMSILEIGHMQVRAKSTLVLYTENYGIRDSRRFFEGNPLKS